MRSERQRIGVGKKEGKKESIIMCNSVSMNLDYTHCI